MRGALRAWTIRLGAGLLGVALLGAAFVTFFHLVPDGWSGPTADRMSGQDHVRMRTADGWVDASRVTSARFDRSDEGLFAQRSVTGAIGPKDPAVRAMVDDDLLVKATGATGAHWSFPARNPFEPRATNISIAEVWMSGGAPLVVAVDVFQYVGQSKIQDHWLEHWVAIHDSHRFVDDGRRFERVVERHAYVEPVSGIVVAWNEHEQLWMHWSDRARDGLIQAVIAGPVSGRSYLPVWDAWTNTTDESASAMADLAFGIKSSRLMQMVGMAAPMALAGEVCLFTMFRPPRSWSGL